MPYVITTERELPSIEDRSSLTYREHRAVATLEEAQKSIKGAVPLGEWSGVVVAQINALSEPGLAIGRMTVGPLPDGTVIGVERVDTGVLESALPPESIPFDATPRWIIDAYNARQGS